MKLPRPEGKNDKIISLNQPQYMIQEKNTSTHLFLFSVLELSICKNKNDFLKKYWNYIREKGIK